MLEGDIGECCICRIGISKGTKHYKKKVGCDLEIIRICEDCYKEIDTFKEVLE